jgi:hypothetical protein
MTFRVLSALFACSGFVGSTAAAQECPIFHKSWEGEERANLVCEAIQSFNQNGFPGGVADDCDGDDCCDDDDPTWMPSPPYNAIVSMGPWGLSIFPLQEDVADELYDALSYSNLLEQNDGYGLTRQTPSLDNGYGFDVPEQMRYLAEQQSWVREHISRGNLVYYYLRNQVDGY